MTIVLCSLALLVGLALVLVSLVDITKEAVRKNRKLEVKKRKG